MSRSSGRLPSATLIADAGNRSVEIEILDGSFNPVPLEHNVGRVTAKLDLGAYIVRFRVGTEVREKLVVLGTPGATETVGLFEPGSGERLEFATSAPVRDTYTSREYHEDGAAELSRSKPLPPPAGQEGGGHLMIFARAIDTTMPVDVSKGLTLWTAAGEPAADLAEVGEHRPSERWSGAHLGLDPGPYRLRVERSSETFTEQMVYVCKGWQSQVFLLAQPVGPTGKRWRLDPGGMSLLMSKPAEGFIPARPDQTSTEAALRALEGGRLVSSSEEHAMLWTKFRNPMLGIYGALLHLRHAKPKMGLMDTVFRNLYELVGPVPDVLAIGWAVVAGRETTTAGTRILRKLEEAGPIETPPMLRGSWQLLLEANRRNRELIPRGSLADRVAARTFVTSPWLVWQVTGEELEEERVGRKRGIEPLADLVEAKIAGARPDLPDWLAGKTSVLNFLGKLVQPVIEGAAHMSLEFLLRKLAGHLQSSREAAYLLESSRYTDAERRVARYITPLADPAFRQLLSGSPALRKRLAEPLKPKVGETKLLEDLQLPVSTALGAAFGLWTKLMAFPVVPHPNTVRGFIGVESQGNETLRRILREAADTTVPLRHRLSGTQLNRLQFLYLRYRNSPSAKKTGAPSATELAELLDDNDFVAGEHDGRISGWRIDQLLADARTDIRAAFVDAVAAGKLPLDPEFSTQVLPPPNRYEPGGLFPAPAPDPSLAADEAAR